MLARRPLAFLLVCVIAGGFFGGWVMYLVTRPSHPVTSPATTLVPEPAPANTRQDDPPYRALDANLYMQTAAEYRACCLQAYTLAELRLRGKVALKSGGGKPAAVVFDLDETVLDNAAFQTRQIREGWVYDQKRWDEYEEKGGNQVGLIPGAKEFILTLRGYETSPVYITNRNEKFRAQTKAVLKRHGIEVPDEQLLLATTTSDKTARRKMAEEKFDVLLYVGDNLRDFDDVFKYDKGKGIAGRKAAVDANRAKFGTDWIILPNPAYGEWTKPFGQGAKDADLLGPATPKGE